MSSVIFKKTDIFNDADFYLNVLFQYLYTNYCRLDVENNTVIIDKGIKDYNKHDAVKFNIGERKWAEYSKTFFAEKHIEDDANDDFFIMKSEQMERLIELVKVKHLTLREAAPIIRVYFYLYAMEKLNFNNYIKETLGYVRKSGLMLNESLLEQVRFPIEVGQLTMAAQTGVSKNKIKEYLDILVEGGLVFRNDSYCSNGYASFSKSYSLMPTSERLMCIRNSYDDFKKSLKNSD